MLTAYINQQLTSDEQTCENGIKASLLLAPCVYQNKNTEKSQTSTKANPVRTRRHYLDSESKPFQCTNAMTND